MAVINFPDSPSDGATQTVGGITYTYSSSKGYWTAAASSGGGGGGGASVTTDDTAPSSPSDGDLWYDTDDGGMFVYYADTDSSQWVEVIGSQGATGDAGADGGAGVASVYATVNDLPVSGNTQGDMAHVTANNTLYFWNGSGWYKIALINTNPSISGVSSSYALAIDGTATTVTVTASDPEGLPITYSIASDTSGNIATVSQGTGANTNVFTITPSTNTAYAGSFTLTFRASDGVNIATAPATFTLQFIVQNSNYTTALITTGGSAGTNSTFTDSSSNSHTITASGNATQNSFSPYRSGGYSLFCNGSGGDYIKTDTSADFAFGSNDFTVECWYYPVSKAQNYPRILHFGEYWSNSNAWALLDRHNSQSTKFTVHAFAFSPSTILESTTTVSNNQWYHLAVVRSGTTITLYVDGVAEDTYDISTNNYPDASSTSYLSLLNVSNGANLSEAQANGYLRDVRVVQGTAVYTSAFTPPTESLTAVSNTKFLLGSIPYIFDSSTSSHTFTQTTGGDYSTQPFGPYDYQEYAVGDHGGSAYFDGTGDYLSAGDDATFELGSGDFTIETWVYLTGYSNSYSGYYSAGICGKDNTTTRSYSFQIGGTASSYTSLYFSMFVGGSPNTTTYNTTFNLNQWYHVAVSRESGTLKMFIDGVLVQTNTSANQTPTEGSQPLVVGAGGTYSGYEYTLPGYLTDFRFVKGTAVYTADFTPPTAPLTAITYTSLLLRMQGAKILDKSQSVKSLPLAGDTTASTAQYKYLPTSMYFDGTGDSINIEDDIIAVPANTAFTLEFWIKMVGGNSADAIFDWGRHANGDSISLLSQSDGQFQVYTGSAGAFASYGTNYADLRDGTWRHFALSRTSAGAAYTFVDGTIIESATGWTAAVASNNQFRISGLAGYSGYEANFYMSDLRITKGLARYTANFTPPTAALQG